MGISHNEKLMEGWLYLIRTNRLGLQYCRKRYFVLQGNSLDCYKAIPQSNREDHVRSALIDPRINVTDNGRESVNRNIFFMFTLYSAFNQNDQLKLGATSSEEAARWIQSFREASSKDFSGKAANGVAPSRKRGQSLRLSRSKTRSGIHCIDWTTLSSAYMDSMATDTLASSPWTIFGCTNGLRLFKGAKDGYFHQKNWDYHPAVMAVGVIDANSEDIFRTLMSVGPTRSEWDFCLSRGSIVEHLSHNTDIIHKKLHADWLPRGMTRRDLVLQRHWRREDDGTYAIIYHSVFHPNCRPEKRYIRAYIKSGGYVISPMNQGKQSVVKHMLAIDWKTWRSYFFASSDEYITIRMLARVAALRDFFQAKVGKGACSHESSGDLKREIGFPESEKEDIKLEMHSRCENNKNVDSLEESPYYSPRSCVMEESFLQLSDGADEFFDVHDFDQSQAICPFKEDMHSQLLQDRCHLKLTTDSVHVNRLQNHVALMDDMAPCSYGTTLSKDPTCTSGCSWTSADPSTFLVRDRSYLQDHRKVKAKSTLMEMVGADWIKSDNREDDLGGRPGGIVQKCALQNSSKFFFIVNMQVPASSSMYSLGLYYMMDWPLENVPLLKGFIEGDDAYRNSRFKLIPFISKGSWIVKQSVGKKACLVGQSLKLNYFQGRNYFEIGVDVSSSVVGRNVSGLVLSYLNTLVVEMAFLIQGNTHDELPEVLIGTCRLNHMDVSKSVSMC